MNEEDRQREIRHYQTERIREDAFYIRENLKRDCKYQQSKKYDYNSPISKSDVFFLIGIVSAVAYTYVTLL